MGYGNTTFPGSGGINTVANSGVKAVGPAGPDIATASNQLQGLLAAAIARKNSMYNMAGNTQMSPGRTAAPVEEAPAMQPKYVKILNEFGQVPGEVQVRGGEPGAVFGGYY